MCAQQFCEAGNWVWTVWKRYEVSGTRPEIFFAPFGRGLRVNGGWRETYFWDVCPDRVQTVQTSILAGIQVVSCAARPLTLRVASGYRGGVFFELTRD